MQQEIAEKCATVSKKGVNHSYGVKIVTLFSTEENLKQSIYVTKERSNLTLQIMMDIDGAALGTVDNNELLQLLECPVCLDHITPPMKQCVKGHLVCNECFPRLPHCPTCRSAMNPERNLAIEQMARLLKYPCRYYPMGCREAFILSKKTAHERDCPFLQLKCPFHGQCAFNGSLKDVVPHLASDHSVTPVPVQPMGTLFYRAKHFYRRNVWTLIFTWDDNLFR